MYHWFLVFRDIMWMFMGIIPVILGAVGGNVMGEHTDKTGFEIVVMAAAINYTFYYMLWSGYIH